MRYARLKYEYKCQIVKEALEELDKEFGTMKTLCESIINDYVVSLTRCLSNLATGSFGRC